MPGVGEEDKVSIRVKPTYGIGWDILRQLMQHHFIYCSTDSSFLFFLAHTLLNETVLLFHYFYLAYLSIDQLLYILATLPSTSIYPTFVTRSYPRQ